jgi:hypothetical protein
METVVMVNMTDPTVARTVCQLDSYGLYGDVGRAIPATPLQTVSLSLLEKCEVEFNVPMTVPFHPALAIDLQATRSFKGLPLCLSQTTYAIPFCVPMHECWV